MAIINPYLTFEGNCEEAFNHYKSVFGGEFTYVGRFSDMPPQEGIEVSEDVKNKIMHISLPISKQTILMGSDNGNWTEKTTMGNNISISITAASKEEADKLFNGLSENGKVTMPIDDVFWGDYFGMCTDRYGISWMVSYNPEFVFE